jgi:hypothetical protein
MSEIGVMNKKQIYTFERHFQELLSWPLKFNVIHERHFRNYAIESVFSITSHNYDVLQAWESEVA